jgi:serine/threonine protein kinase
VNRDVKPANILISEEPNGALARIIDLGAAVDIRNGYNYDPKVAKPNRIKPNRTRQSSGGVRRRWPGGGRAPANRAASVEPALVTTGGQRYAGNVTQVGFLDPKYAPPEKYVLPESVSALSLLASPFLWVLLRANPRTTRTCLSPRPYKLDTNPILPFAARLPVALCPAPRHPLRETPAPCGEAAGGGVPYAATPAIRSGLTRRTRPAGSRRRSPTASTPTPRGWCSCRQASAPLRTAPPRTAPNGAGA